MEESALPRVNIQKLIPLLAISLGLAALVNYRFRGGGTELEPGEIFRQYPIMNTMVGVRLYGPPETLEAAADAARHEFDLVVAMCDVFNPESELSRLNRQAAAEPFACGDELWHLLMAAKVAHQLSDGAFDITIRPLMDLWGLHRRRESVPSQEEIDAALELVGLDKVVFDAATQSVRFTVPGMSLDLGGIAKGYAAERAAAAAVRAGARAGLVNLGGDIHCLPDPPPGREFYRVAVRNPLDKTGTIGVVELPGGSITTSGDYERYVMLDGVRHSHIMDPRRGKPVRGRVSVTAIHPSGTFADAMATAVLVAGVELAEKLHALDSRAEFLVIGEAVDDSPPPFHQIGSSWENMSPR